MGKDRLMQNIFFQRDKISGGAFQSRVFSIWPKQPPSWLVLLLGILSSGSPSIQYRAAADFGSIPPFCSC
jgi:hypothetical protein